MSAKVQGRKVVFGVLGSFWSRLGAVLGPSGSRQGASWALLGPLWAFSGPLGERTDYGIADLAKFAFRLHESTILGSP